MVEMNQIFYVSLIVRKTKVFVSSPNFRLNNCIPVLLRSFFNISISCLTSSVEISVGFASNFS